MPLPPAPLGPPSPLVLLIGPFVLVVPPPHCVIPAASSTQPSSTQISPVFFMVKGLLRAEVWVIRAQPLRVINRMIEGLLG